MVCRLGSAQAWNGGRVLITFEEFEMQWLDDIQAGSPTTTQLGNRFAQKILRDWHEIDDTGAEVILCDGAGDGGIDAAVFVKADPTEGIDGSRWILVQSKYGTALGGPSTITLEAQKLFATLEGRRTSLSSLSTELVDRLRNFLSNKGDTDRLEYVVATSRKLTDDELEYLRNVRVIGRDKFGECFDTDTVSIETIYNKVCEEQQVNSYEISVSLRTSVTASTEDLHIGATTLPDIFTFMNDYKNKSGDLDMLYEKNVRKFLGNKRKVNKGIEKTIETTPERFGLYNNGITNCCGETFAGQCRNVNSCQSIHRERLSDNALNMVSTTEKTKRRRIRAHRKAEGLGRAAKAGGSSY